MILRNIFCGYRINLPARDLNCYMWYETNWHMERYARSNKFLTSYLSIRFHGKFHRSLLEKWSHYVGTLIGDPKNETSSRINSVEP